MLDDPHDIADQGILSEPITVQCQNFPLYEQMLPPDTIADQQLLRPTLNRDCLSLLNRLREKIFINASGENTDMIENISLFLDE